MIRRRWNALALASAFVVSSVLYAPPAQAEETCDPVSLVCLSVVDGVATVTGPGGLNLSQAVPPVTVQVPGPTITVPGPTVTVPGPKITIPGPTVTVPIPGPTRTVERTIPGPTATVTAPPVTKTVTPPTVTVPPTGQESNTSATIAQEPPVESKPGHVTVIQAVGYSALAIMLGMVTALLGMYAMFRLGRQEGERSLDDFIEELRDTIRRK